MPRLPTITVLLALCLSQTTQADVVIEWNETASDVLVNNIDKQNPGMASRTLAMMNLAIHDSFAMGQSGGQTFYDYGQMSSGSYSASAAAAQAAFTVLNSIYPDQQGMLQNRLSATMAGIADSTSKAAGIAMGSMIGQSIVARRNSDGYDSNRQYIPSNEPGRWRPDPLNPGQEAWGPDWGNVRTFALESNRQFLPPPMPALDSVEYANAFNEVKELGALNSATRTAEQTEIGNFWAYDRVGMGTPFHLYNQAMRTIATELGNTEVQNAEMFAKAAVAAADAGIVAWNAKFEYDLWRPVTGIREADLDGNPLTEADPLWIPLGAPGGDGNNFTPPFPTYISGHATFGAAIFESLRESMLEFYGTDEITFTLYSDELMGAGRTFNSLTDAILENGRSRVYLGIHWNFDDTLGQETGRNIAQYIAGRPFTAAVPEPSGFALLGIAAIATLRRRRRHIA